MTLVDLILISICVILAALMIYTVYRKSRTPDGSNKRIVEELADKETIFKDELSPDQIQSLYKFFTNSS